MARVALWYPLLIEVVLLLALTAAHYYIFSPLTGPLVGAWAKLVSPNFAGSFTHYPAHLVLFPYYFGLARIVLAIVIEGFLWGILADLFISRYRGTPPLFAVSVRRAAARYLALTAVWAVLMLILLAVSLYFYDFLEKVIGYSLQAAPRRRLLARLMLELLKVVIYVPFIFLLPSIMANSVSLGQAIRRGVRVALAHPVISFGLILIPYLIGLFPSWAAGESETIVSKFSPELVVTLTLVSIAVDAVANFLLVGTAVKFYMDQST